MPATADAVLKEYKDNPEPEVPTSEVLRTVYQLSPEAIQLLREAASDPNGDVLVIRTFEGLHVQTGGKQFVNPKDTRSAAIWQGAVRQLLQNGLLEDSGCSHSSVTLSQILTQCAGRIGGVVVLVARGTHLRKIDAKWESVKVAALPLRIMPPV